MHTHDRRGVASHLLLLLATLLMTFGCATPAVQPQGGNQPMDSGAGGGSDTLGGGGDALGGDVVGVDAPGAGVDGAAADGAVGGDGQAADAGAVDSGPALDSGASTDTGGAGDSSPAGDTGNAPLDGQPAADAGPGDGWSWPDSGGGGAGSCVGKCGLYSASASCQCDDQCTTYGDCCADYKQVCGGAGASCAGKCGKYDQNASCQCDSACVGAGDCCADYGSLCGGAPLDGGGTPLDGGTTPLDGGTTPLDGGGLPLDGGGPPLDGGGVSDAGWSDGGGGSDVGGGPTLPCGVPCPKGQVCNGTTCTIPACTLPGAVTAQWLDSLAILPEKQGCDLDSDAAPDNVLGKMVGIYAAINAELKDQIKSGELTLLLLPQGYNASGTAFPMALHSGAPATPGTSYWLHGGGFDLTTPAGNVCPAHQVFDPTTVKSAALSGSAKGSIDLPFPLFFMWTKSVPFLNVQLKGAVAGSGWSATSGGMICGVLRNSDLMAAIDAIPPEVVKNTGFDKATLKSLISGVLKPDIDTDGDNKPDAISAAMSFTSKQVSVLGVK